MISGVSPYRGSYEYVSSQFKEINKSIDKAELALSNVSIDRNARSAFGRIFNTHDLMTNYQTRISEYQYAQDAYSLIRNHLEDIRELIVESDSNPDRPVTQIQSDMDRIFNEMKNLIKSAKFEGKSIIDLGEIYALDWLYSNGAILDKREDYVALAQQQIDVKQVNLQNSIEGLQGRVEDLRSEYDSLRTGLSNMGVDKNAFTLLEEVRNKIKDFSGSAFPFSYRGSEYNSVISIFDDVYQINRDYMWKFFRDMFSFGGFSAY